MLPGYGSLRVTEADGLWHERRWAKWLAAGSASLYIPFELLEIGRTFIWLSLISLGINVLTVARMVDALRSGHAPGERPST